MQTWLQSFEQVTSLDNLSNKRLVVIAKSNVGQLEVNDGALVAVISKALLENIYMNRGHGLIFFPNHSLHYPSVDLILGPRRR